MFYKLFLQLLIPGLLLASCIGKSSGGESWNSNIKTWGYKAVYGPDSIAKKIIYSPNPQVVTNGGNIYAFQNYIFQVDPGLGIHVIDNSTPSSAHRIGFITVKGCAQISIKDGKIYTNNFDDLVVLQFIGLNDVVELSRLKAVFTESKLAEPPLSGYYECPRPDSFVVDWKKDSVFQRCYKF
jgi:hypothetical protein